MAHRKLQVTFLLCFLLATLTSAKIYERCELARELKYSHGAPMNQLATWVCLADKEANYNTAKINNDSNGSKDYGIFQINNKYWCYPPGKGCSLSCTDLVDNKIADDFQCAQKVYEETKRLKGDGFLAWTLYKFCKGSEVNKYLEGCFP